MSPTYPGPTAANLACLPRVLRARPQWILWRGRDRVVQGVVHLDKLPIDPQTLLLADTTDPATWGTSPQAEAALPLALEEWETTDPQAYRGGGLGYVLTDDDPYVGIDLDHCVDAVTGALEPWAQQIVDALQSYTEITPSGTGLHIWVQGTLPPRGRKKGAIELYSTARFFTMTGWHLDPTPATVEPRQMPLTALWCQLFGAQVGDSVWLLDPAGVITNHNGVPWVLTAIDPYTTGELYGRFAEMPGGWPLAQCERTAPHVAGAASPVRDDATIITTMLRARNAATIQALAQGDWAPRHHSQSEADLAFCVHLAFYTQDAAQIDRLFRTTALLRAKWDQLRGSHTYGQRTIAEALARQTTHYTSSWGLALPLNGQGTPPGPPSSVWLPPLSPPGWSLAGVTPALPPPPLDWRTQLLSKKSGGLIQDVRNISLILEHAPFWRQQFWWDEIGSRPMLGSTRLDEDTLVMIARWLGTEEAMSITNLRMLERCVLACCRAQRQDLLHAWLTGLSPWDGTSRLTTWLTDVAGVEPSVYGQEVSRLLILSMVARAVDPGCLCRYVVILEGPEECGKSSLVQALASEPWYVVLSIGLETKDSHMMLQGAWVAEMAELDSLSRTEETRLKAFITMRQDSYIPKYSNFRESHPRRAIFIGTTNEESYLKGQTGNTRFLPIKVTRTIDVEGFCLFRDQLFAEALTVYHANPQWWVLSTGATERAKEERERRRQVNVYEQSLHEWLEYGRFAVTHYQGTSLVTFHQTETSWPEIAQHFLRLDTPEKWKDMNLQKQIAQALKTLGWHSAVVWRQGRTTKVWAKV